MRHSRIQVALKRTVLSLLGTSLAACLSAPPQELATASSPPPSPIWEYQDKTQYSHYGVGTIERVGNRYLLRIDCGGIHDVYADVHASSAPDLQLDAYLGAPIRAHYAYETRVNPNIRCIQPPCAPIPERIALIRHVERLTETEAGKAHAERECAQR